MVSQAALDYVRRQLNAGIKPDAVRAAMKKAGWKDNDIEAAFVQASGTGAEAAVEETHTTETRIHAPEGKKTSGDIYTASFAIGRLLPAVSVEDINMLLAELGRVAEKMGFKEFSGLVEGLRLTIEGQDLETAQYEVARVGAKLKQVFEEEINQKKG